MKKVLLIAALTGACLQGYAQRVIDIYKGPGGSSPYSFTELNGFVYFGADDGKSGIELWKTAGTRASTTLVKDINSGTYNSTPTQITRMGNAIYFLADDGTHGIELWKSDGTQGGTVMVKNGFQGANEMPVNEMIVVGNTLFFTLGGCDELWKSDGTEAGTVRVMDVYTGTNTSTPHIIRKLTEVNGKVYFIAPEGFDMPNGGELWVSDGTEAGTGIVKNIKPGAAASYVRDLTKALNTLFFVADDGTNGFELWKTDGTEAGTVMVKNILPEATSSDPRYMTEMNGMLYFSVTNTSGQNELWKSDGTDVNTEMVKTFSYIGRIAQISGTLLLAAADDVYNVELWKSDGTESGSSLVKEIQSGSGAGMGLGNWFLAYDGKLFFQADDIDHGRELWETDGTADGTKLALDITDGGSTLFSNEAVVLGKIYLSADDGLSGSEVYIYPAEKEGPAGIGREAETNQLTVYPNPGKGMFHMKNLERPVTVQVYNSLGKLVSVQETSGAINLTGFANGFYQLKFIDGDRVYVGRLIKN